MGCTFGEFAVSWSTEFLIPGVQRGQESIKNNARPVSLVPQQPIRHAIHKKVLEESSVSNAKYCIEVVDRFMKRIKRV